MWVYAASVSTAPQAPSRKRTRRGGPVKPPTPEEQAAAALGRAGGDVDAKMQLLPCAVCGQFPGECVDQWNGQPHEYTAPEPIRLEFNAEPLITRGVELPSPEDQVHVWRHVEVPAVHLGGIQTRILAYVPGDIISRDEAYRVGLLVDLRKDPGEPLPPAPPAPPERGYDLDLDAGGAMPYMPPRGEWTR
jgi:hypothetical protein